MTGLCERLREQAAMLRAHRREPVARSLDAAVARIEALEAAATALVSKLDKVTEDSAWLFSFAAAHGCEYNGAQYGAEFDALRALLSDSSQ